MSKKFFKFFGFFLIACAGIFGLAACDNKEEFKVEFMVQDDANAWTVLREEKVVEGAVALPEAPAKTYYTFAGWFGEEALSTKFDGKDIKASAKAYAKYTPNQVKITINGEDQGTKNLIDVVNASYNPGEGLQFNGWYKDSACEVKWDYKDDVTELFAESVALVTYTNGYETLWTELVKPGTVLENPATRVVEDTTFETKYIVQDYMSKYDIDYVDENGKAIDFTKPVTKSSEVTVLWNTKGLTGFKELPKSTEGHYYLQLASQFVKEVQDARVISIRNNITVEKQEGEEITTETYTVDYIYGYTNCLPDSVKKIILGEGIKAISHFNGVAASSVEVIDLPSTLKIIDNSFNNMPKLKSVTLPEGLEVLISSFFINRYTQTVVDHGLGETNTNIEISIPDSVKNLSMMPNNLKFSKTETTAEVGDFYKGEDGRIYLNHKDGKVLVADPAAVTGAYEITAAGLSLPKAETIVVPEGVVGIQVGTYMTCFDYLVMPKSFKFINHNANISDYKEFYDVYTDTKIQMSGNVLFDQAQYDQYIATNVNQPKFTNDSNIEFEGLTLTTNVGGFMHPFGIFNCGAGVISMPTTKEACPKGIEMAFLKGSYNVSALPHLDDYVNYVDETNNVYLTAAVLNPANFFPNTINLKLQVENISFAAIKEALVAAKPFVQGALDNLKSFEIYNNGVKVEDGAAVTSDMFLTVVIVENPKLIVKADYRISVGDNWSTADDPSSFNMEWDAGKTNAIIKDLTDLSKEKILAIVLDEATKAKAEEYSYEATEEQIRANLKWSYDNALSVKITIDGKEVTDFSKITLENGDVTINVEYEFADYAA